MLRLVRRFLKDDCGGNSIQYVFIAISISIAIFVSVNGLGPKPNTTFSNLGSAVGLLTRLVDK